MCVYVLCVYVYVNVCAYVCVCACTPTPAVELLDYRRVGLCICTLSAEANGNVCHVSYQEFAHGMTM